LEDSSSETGAEPEAVGGSLLSSSFLELPSRSIGGSGRFLEFLVVLEEELVAEGPAEIPSFKLEGD